MSGAVFISGGTSGIGFACAERLLGAGRAVFIVGSREESVEAALPRLTGARGTVCDVADDAAVVSAFDEARDQLGPITGVFVNAGVDGQAANTLELEAAPFRRLLDVNVVGAFSVGRAGALQMVEDGEVGSIVFNASVNGLRPEPGFADYNASKAAVISLAQTMAIELADRKIAVTAICPGYVRTPMVEAYLEGDPHERILADIPLGRVAEPSEIARLVEFLLQAEAAYLTGAVIPIAGGRNV
jgi:NAD(P)-dependent dehydrogenase (short-subunit alcohol dehydrogenase family)